MALIKCKYTGGCPHELNTKLACEKVTSLFGLRQFLETELENRPLNTDIYNEINNHLDFIKQQLEEFKIKEEDKEFQTFRINKAKGDLQPVSSIRELYLTCAANHSYYYSVDCTQ